MQTRGGRKKPSNSQDVCVCTTCKCIFRDPRTATPHRNTSDLTLTAGIRLRQLTMSSFLCPRRRDGFIEGEDLREEKGGVVVERQEERVWPAGYGGSGRRFLFFLTSRLKQLRPRCTCSLTRLLPAGQRRRRRCYIRVARAIAASTCTTPPPPAS